MTFGLAVLTYCTKCGFSLLLKIRQKRHGSNLYHENTKIKTIIMNSRNILLYFVFLVFFNHFNHVCIGIQHEGAVKESGYNGGKMQIHSGKVRCTQHKHAQICAIQILLMAKGWNEICIIHDYYCFISNAGTCLLAVL